MNKDEVTPVPIRNIILRFNLLDWFQVFKMLFWINITYLIIAAIYLNFFKVLNFFSVRFLQINLYEKEKDATNFITELVTGINQSGDNFEIIRKLEHIKYELKTEEHKNLELERKIKLLSDEYLKTLFKK